MRRILGLAAVLMAVATGAVAGTASSMGSQSLQIAPPLLNQDMIVILKDQLPALPPSGVRKAAIAGAHAPFLAQLQSAAPRAIRSFHLINAFSARLSTAEVAQLAAHPAVLAVVHDKVMRLQKRPLDASGQGGAPQATPALCGTLEPEALQLTRTAYADPSVPQAQQVVDGNGVKVTGQGVKVAIIADGLDTNLPAFFHTDGTPVFIDYQDFSGDPAGTSTDGAEMFGDASSIAANDMPRGHPLTFDISTFVNAAHPLPSPCNIRIRGVAPGASLIGLKVFGSYTTNSSFVQAIEYAVLVSNADVINESFGGNPVYDDSQDPISMANQLAVAAGVTVVTSSGDAGTAGTIGSPATAPWDISVGATTSFRAYQQTSDGLMPLATGYVSDNISSLSSGGFAQATPRTVDLVAPGDIGWALCSSNNNLYTGCIDYNGGNPSPIQVFGGTSQSSPLTSAASALVIQAYRSTHGGRSPSPALVKQILMSSAEDLGAPSFEQGAGRLDTYRAVQTALSIKDANGSPSARGASLLLSPTSFDITAATDDALERRVTITNTGLRKRVLAPTLEKLGAPFAGNTVAVQLNPATDPTYINVVGATRHYVTTTFKVPAGAEHLDASMSFIPTIGSHAKVVAFALLDPQGRQAAYSIPQGAASGYGHIDVVEPAAGTWTAVFRTSGVNSSSSYTGTVQFTWAAERYQLAGFVFPAVVTLAPGESAKLNVVFESANRPGDYSAAIRFRAVKDDDSNGRSQVNSQIPVTVRALVPLGNRGGSFTGTLTGGNGRPAASPTQTFVFDVPAGVNDLSLTLSLADSGYALVGYLIDPNGMLLGAASNVDLAGAPQKALAIIHAIPRAGHRGFVPGRWRFVLTEPVASGAATSIAFNGQIKLNAQSVSIAGLPRSTSTVLTAGRPLAATVTVTNTGAVAKAYFVDARTADQAIVQLPVGFCYGAYPQVAGSCFSTIVPPRATAAGFEAQASVPIQMDAAFFLDGSPDLFAKPLDTAGTVQFASLAVPEVPFGLWVWFPSLIGPFGPAGADISQSITGASAAALMQPFDANVTSDTGNYWSDNIIGGATFTGGLVLAPGQMGTINVTITPQAGQTVHGVLYVETQNLSDVNATGDDVAAIPYAYSAQ